MNRYLLVSLAVVLFVVLIVAVVIRGTVDTVQEPPIVPNGVQRPAGLPTRELLGTMSCSASVCHGESDLGRHRSEATTWRTLDPHARAYETLTTSESHAIAKHLWRDNPLASQAPLCLKCHVYPDHDQASANFRKQDGVGCESCHGAAQDWLTPHYRQNWQSAKSEDKLKVGFTDMKSLPGRIAVCVKCHVGTPGSEVDHELIAAGHPPLRFEFATYFANLPPHWDVARDRQANPEMRVWSVGQLVTSASALELLAHRADPANGKSWPELAEFDCFSCHHDLQASSWRRDKKHLQQRPPGSLVVGSWYSAMLPDVLAVSKEPAASLEAVRGLLEHRDPKKPGPFSKQGRGEIARHAKELAKRFGEIAKIPAADDPGSLLAWLHRLSLDRPLDSNWDEATQRYLALLALRQMARDAKEPKSKALERIIADLEKEVTFSRDFNGPRRFVPAALRSPKEKK